MEATQKRVRNEYDIFAEILKFCSFQGKTITQINHVCYLKYKLALKCVNLLVEKGLLRVETGKKLRGRNPHLLYYTTEKGKEYLKAYFEMQRLIGGEEFPWESLRTGAYA
ncbi:MAG: winged helix-turn-helix domain-containing protein [Candidatus Bathyarchaeia archaeon]